MKITIVTGPFLPTPPGPAGAVERVWYALAEEFVRQGHEVTFLSRRQSDRPDCEVIHGVTHIRRTNLKATGTSVLNILKDVAYGLRLRPALPKSDVIVINDVSLPFFAQLCKNGGKIAVNVQRMPKVNLKFYPRIDRFYAVSSAVREAITQQSRQAYDRTTIVSNPIDTEVFFDNGSTRPDKPIIGYTGRIHPEKGLELLVDAARKLASDVPELAVRMYGEWDAERGGGGKDYRDMLLSRAAEMDVQILPAEYDRQKLADVIRGFRVYVYPSIAEQGETFGVAPVEAMACGRAPVLSGLSVFRDYLTPEENGLIFDHKTPDAVDQFANQLKRALLDDALNQRLAANAAETARRFSIANIAAQYLSDFEKLVADA